MKLRLTSVNELLHILTIASMLYDTRKLSRIIDYEHETIKGLQKDYRYYSFNITCDRKSMIVSFIRLEEVELCIECPFNRELDFELLKILKSGMIRYSEYDNKQKLHYYAIDLTLDDKENRYFVDFMEEN